MNVEDPRIVELERLVDNLKEQLISIQIKGTLDKLETMQSQLDEIKNIVRDIAADAHPTPCNQLEEAKKTITETTCLKLAVITDKLDSLSAEFNKHKENHVSNWKLIFSYISSGIGWLVATALAILSYMK
jgi:hypothetical protein